MNILNDPNNNILDDNTKFDHLESDNDLESGTQNSNKTILEPKLKINEVTVFTDGSCMRQKDNKGKEFLSCGYGIYYPNKELPNVSRALKNDPPTNNRAELQAIYVAIIQVKKKYDFNKLIIYSDSKYCIQALTEYVKVWRVNGWKTSKKQPVENQDIIKPLDNMITKLKDKVIFVHVRAHTKKQDAISLNNDMADKLAKWGAEKSIPYYVQ